MTTYADLVPALADALPLLGYNKVYHMREVDWNEGHREAWTKLVHAKYGPDKRTIRPEELRSLLADYDVSLDRFVAFGSGI
jgi:hypothetical protein